jgi:hypothetical protein
MAKANDKSSTIAWIWLHDALMLAIPRFGSVVLAKERLREWLTAGELPWSCMSWKGLNAEKIATLDREQKGWIVGHIFPSVAYHEGDPQFWRANLHIDWEENEAREKATGGARAQGIKASRERLLALLPEEPLNEFVEKPEPEQTRPAEPERLKPTAWLNDVRKDNPRKKNEPLATYAGRLHALMPGAHVTKLWTVETLLRRLHDK